MSERVSNERAEQIAGKQFIHTEALLALDLLDARRELDEAKPVLEAAREVAKLEFTDWTDEELKESVGWAGQRHPKSTRLAALVLAVRECAAARASGEER